MWYDNPQKKSNYTNWLANLKKIATVETVEDFWGLYNNIIKASAMPCGSNYHFFRHDVQPMWEDPENAQGGKWTLNLPKNKRDSIDNFWLNVLLGIIGEAFGSDELNDEICGIVFAPRQKQDRISLWTKHVAPAAVIEQVGRKFKEFMGIEDELRISFQQHEDAIKSTSATPSSTPGSIYAGGAKDSRELYVL